MKGKVLVTGGAGFIGSAVAKGYLKTGWEVVIVDNLSTGKKENLPDQAKFYQIDIRDKKLQDVFKKEKFDLVNHHAAQINVRESVGHPSFDAQVNILGTINLLKIGNEFKTRNFIFISSGGAIYGEPAKLPVEENNPKNPLSPYAISKYTAERYLFFFHQVYGINYLCLRYGNVYGPGQNAQTEAGVIAIFSHQMLQKKRPTIYGDGKQLRDYVWVGDVVKANLLATAKMEKLNQNKDNHPDDLAYNIATGQGVSVNTVYNTLASLTKFDHPPLYASAIKGEIRKIYLKIDRAKSELRWIPQTTLSEGMKKTVEYLKSTSL